MSRFLVLLLLFLLLFVMIITTHSRNVVILIISITHNLKPRPKRALGVVEGVHPRSFASPTQVHFASNESRVGHKKVSDIVCTSNC